MKRNLLILCPLITIPAAFLFKLKYSVAELHHYNKELDEKIVKTEESIRLLKVDCAYLSNPRRIEKLAIEHLNMQPTKPEQIKKE